MIDGKSPDNSEFLKIYGKSPNNSFSKGNIWKKSNNLIVIQLHLLENSFWAVLLHLLRETEMGTDYTLACGEYL